MRERERQRKSEKSEKAREGETLDKKVKRFSISAVGGRGEGGAKGGAWRTAPQLDREGKPKAQKSYYGKALTTGASGLRYD